MIRLIGNSTRKEKATAIQNYYIAVAKAIEDYSNIITLAWAVFNNNVNTVAARKVLENAISVEKSLFTEIAKKAYKVFDKTVSRDRKIYADVVDASIKVFEEAIVEAWKEYDKVVRCLYDTRKEATTAVETPTWNTYDTVVVPTWQECYASLDRRRRRGDE